MGFPPGVRRERRFNEAPAILPGKVDVIWDLMPEACDGFNEAPAILPGKASCRASRSSGAARCFNEAPAILPGKVPTTHPWVSAR